MPRVDATIVFLGPSMPVSAARELFQAEYRPPAARGDIYRCLGRGVRRIALIDGLFHGTPSVWQREILAALDEGIDVLGSTSMGALRAAELEPFGMRGLGTIFEWYREGLIDGDDEVALLHSDAESGWRKLSEPLVNVRATLQRAVASKVLDAAEAALLLDESKRTFYPQRSYARLLEGEVVSHWPAARKQELGSWLKSEQVDLKRADAEVLLRHCAQQPPPPLRPFKRAQDSTGAVERALERVLPDGQTGAALMESAFSSDRAARLLPGLFLGWYVEEWAKGRGLESPPEGQTRFRAPGDWLAELGVAGDEYARWVERQALLAWLSSRSDLLTNDPGDPQLRLLAMAGDWLHGWGLEEREPLVDPEEFGFAWPREHWLLIELLLSGEASG